MLRICPARSGYSETIVPLIGEGGGRSAARRRSVFGGAMKAWAVFFGRSRSSGRSGGIGAFRTSLTAAESKAGLVGAEGCGAKASGADAKDAEELEAAEEVVASGAAAGSDTAASW